MRQVHAYRCVISSSSTTSGTVRSLSPSSLGNSPCTQAPGFIASSLGACLVYNTFANFWGLPTNLGGSSFMSLCCGNGLRIIIGVFHSTPYGESSIMLMTPSESCIGPVYRSRLPASSTMSS